MNEKKVKRPHDAWAQFNARQAFALFVAGVLLFAGSFVMFMALADSCTEYGGAWCYFSLGGNNLRGEP